MPGHVHILLGAAMLLAPAAINRSPFLFYDTSHYLEIGRSIVSRLPVVKALAAEPVGEHAAPGGAEQAGTPGEAPPATPGDGEREHPSLSYSGGRSPYYSAALYMLIRIGGLWAPALVQAVLASTLLWFAVIAVRQRRSEALYYALTAALTLATTLPYFAGMLMPDVFAGFALLSLALLVLRTERWSTPGRFGLALLAGASFAMHATIPIVSAVGLAAMALAAWYFKWRGAFTLNRVAWAAAPFVLAVFGSLAFGAASRIVLGDSPRSPPFLMARVLADGPGRIYLKEACHPEPRFELCRFERNTFVTADDFLWGVEPGVGVFNTVDYATRTRLQAEELRFVLGTLAAHPVAQAEVSARHWLDQFLSFGVQTEFKQAALSWNRMSFEDTIPDQGARYRSGLAYRGLFPFAQVDWLIWAGVIASAAWLGYRLSGADVRAELRRSRKETPSCGSLLVTAGFVLVIVLVANAALCGILSGVSDRYQARMIWLAPLYAGLCMAHWGLFRRSVASPAHSRDVRSSQSRHDAPARSLR
jgi:hypothetical protein